MNQRTSCTLLFSLCLCFSTSLDSAANEIDIEVSWDDNNLVTWQIDYDIVGSPLASSFSAMDPNTGSLSATPPFGLVGFVSWFGLGDVFCPLFENGFSGAFWDGFFGVTSSDPNIGIAPDYDANGSHDLYLVAQDTSTINSLGMGSFTLTYQGDSEAACDCFNPGTYTSNDGMATVTVVPEPSAGLLILGGAGMLWMGRRGKR